MIKSVSREWNEYNICEAYDVYRECVKDNESKYCDDVSLECDKDKVRRECKKDKVRK